MKATIKRTITEVDGMRFTGESTYVGNYQQINDFVEHMVADRIQTLKDYHTLEFYSYNYANREALFIYNDFRETWKVIYD